MEQWYALCTAAGKEQEEAALLERKIGREFWACCRIPKKIKVFRSGGILHLLEDVMFPGYVLIRTDNPGGLSTELKRAREFPQPPGGKEELLTAMEEKDLNFLRDVCGENLQRAMGVSRIILDEKNQIIRAEGVLNHYQDRIVKLNLHKRFAIVEVELFNRVQKVLFGVRLEQDQAG